ncbi:hypothetical protein SUGI_0108920 [Cryptomeria japonica]|nr:hypothetical protein SUGI_0108920 [Cryptomeria japonica]
MRKQNIANLARFPAGGCRQVFATRPRSITIFSPPCKGLSATNERCSVYRTGAFGKFDEIRAKKPEVLSLPSDGIWQVAWPKVAKKKMGVNRKLSSNFDRHKTTTSNQYPATGANMVPLGKEKMQENLSSGGRPNTLDREQFGSFLGCEGLGNEVSNKNIKILVETDIKTTVLEPTMLVSSRGEWSIHPTFYDGVINEADIRLLTCPVLINSIEHTENPLPEQYNNITSKASPTHDNCPPVVNIEVKNNNNSSNISDLDKIIDEANSIKNDALMEMTKRISDSVDSLKLPSESKIVENLGQDNEVEQDEMTSRMAVVLEAFDNNVVENLSPEEEAEKRFLIQELLSSMEEVENSENRVGDTTPILGNEFIDAQPQLGEDNGDGVIVSQQTLGIKNIYDGKNLPDCAREAKSRGRKSLNELRLQDGNAKDQGKLTAFFDAGKGKGLPTAP